MDGGDVVVLGSEGVIVGDGDGVGSIVGLDEGYTLGDCDDEGVGFIVGLLLGGCDGDGAGSIVGLDEGYTLGDCDDEGVGFNVGLADGLSVNVVGMIVGAIDGFADGDEDGGCVGEKHNSGIGSSTDSYENKKGTINNASQSF